MSRPTVPSPPTVPAEPTAPSGEAEPIDAALLRIAGVVVLGVIMSILDVTVVNVALPTFQHTFADAGRPASYTAVAWTVTAYTLAMAAVIPLTGWAAGRFGTKRPFMLAVALFTAGSVLCACAPSIEVLIGFRVLQGLGGGMLMPLGMTIVTRAAGPGRIGRLMSILGVPMLLGPIAGPILGGWLIETASWHWIFLINLPLGVVTLVCAWFALPADRANAAESLDLVGLVLMSPGLALFLYGVSSVPDHHTMASPKVYWPMIAGAALMSAFVVRTLRSRGPLLDLRLLRNRELSASVGALFLFSAAFFGGLLLVPTYFQEVRGETTLTSGLLLAPQGLGAMVAMTVSGRLSDRIPIGRIAPLGLALSAIGMLSLTWVSSDSPYWTYLIPALFVMGLGMGTGMMPLFTAALHTLRHHEVAHGTTMVSISRQLATSCGVALMSTLLANDALRHGLVHAFGHAYLVAAVLMLTAFVPLYFLPRTPRTPRAAAGSRADATVVAKP
ncbi:MAG: DHA2 family efflux MFS transporter permease subunit [Nocardioides sp.]|uniref:DHA2 family efflux MFS transporter permease subunit n=1 Tax=Nocardioides sp. TaxID=35761 RepID=UPI0039E5DA53